MNSVMLAFFLAQLAADTAAFAHAPHDLSDVRGGAADVYLLVDIAKYYQLVGTRLCTKSAADTLGFIHARKTVPHDYGVLRTDPCAVPEAETAVCADL